MIDVVALPEHLRHTSLDLRHLVVVEPCPGMYVKDVLPSSSVSLDSCSLRDTKCATRWRWRRRMRARSRRSHKWSGVALRATRALMLVLSPETEEWAPRTSIRRRRRSRKRGFGPSFAGDSHPLDHLHGCSSHSNHGFSCYVSHIPPIW
jgi:hypothetical protein